MGDSCYDLDESFFESSIIIPSFKSHKENPGQMEGLQKALLTLDNAASNTGTRKHCH